MKMRLGTVFGSAVLLLCTFDASAHHVMGGITPDTWTAGLLSGIGHPIIGLDHLAFVIAVGAGAAFVPRCWWWTPLVFILATVLGCLLKVAGVFLPLAEVVVTASVVLLGAMVLSGRAFQPGLYIFVFAASGLFHGWAYGESIVGAEATPLVAYLTGFAIIQYALVLGVIWVVRSLWSANGPVAIQPRLIGGLAAGVGLALLIENIESLIIA